MTSLNSLAIQGATFVRRCEFHPELASTNDRALELTEVDEPYLIVAERQTAGRGRGAHQWWSAEGALTFSIRLSLTIPVERAPMISLAAGSAVCSALSQFVSPVRVKWPNDVYVEGRKICGILTESLPIPSPHNGENSLFRAVIGIGVNVNNSLRNAPEEISSRATALCDLLDTATERQLVLISILQQLEQELATLVNSPEEFVAQWRRLCWLTGREVTLNDGPRSISGRCQGIDAHGALQILTPNGVYRAISGSIESVGPMD